jgi:hypothetical protein
LLEKLSYIPLPEASFAHAVFSACLPVYLFFYSPYILQELAESVLRQLSLSNSFSNSWETINAHCSSLLVFEPEKKYIEIRQIKVKL